MPELPEVETVRRSLEPRIVGRTVIACKVNRRDVIATPDDPAGGFARNRHQVAPPPRRVRADELLVGQRIAAVRRRGKQLAVQSDNGRFLLVHLGMTGQLLHLPVRGPAAQTDHIHVTWRLDDGSRLFFRDPRRFGGVWTLPTPEALEDRWLRLGPDAETIRAPRLRAALAATSRALKPALLDQHTLAGLGNIYVDESLFRARLHPEMPARDLTRAQTSALAGSIRLTLRAAIEARGSTLRDYRDAQGFPGSHQHAHLVYGRAGQPCRRCRTPLCAAVIGQRTTVWCPNCQSRPRTRASG